MAWRANKGVRRWPEPARCTICLCCLAHALSSPAAGGHPQQGARGAAELDHLLHREPLAAEAGDQQRALVRQPPLQHGRVPVFLILSRRHLNNQRTLPPFPRPDANTAEAEALREEPPIVMNAVFLAPPRSHVMNEAGL